MDKDLILELCEHGATTDQVTKHFTESRTVVRDALLELVGRGQLRMIQRGRHQFFYVPEVCLNLAAHDPFNRTGVYA
jgi:DNA-binding transcriptional regulator PaaX